jgi:hypothetical protein
MVPEEEVLAMLLLIVLLMTLIGACFYVTRLAIAGVAPAGSAPADLREPPADVVPESLEGALVTHLFTGEITRRQYRRAMERVAARDDERHPLALPPEAGS